MELYMEPRHQLSPIYKFIIFFILYSVLGWILESFYSLYALGTFTKRGFLFGPMCPIYGYGAIILILFLQKYNKNYLKIFIYSIIAFSILEYATSFILEEIFSMKWWDYSNDFLNLNGRISFFYSIAWGFVAIAFVNLHPLIEKQINKILQKTTYKSQICFINIILTFYAIDTILSIINYLTI